MNELVNKILFAPAASFIFLATILTSLLAFRDEALLDRLILHPYSLVRKKTYWTLFTSGLVHADSFHLILNMLSYYFFAFYLEGLLGHVQFFLFYVATLALSSISTVLKYKNKISYRSLGASGAVSAVIFSFITYYPFSDAYSILIFGIIPTPPWLFGILYLAYSYYMSRSKGSMINHEAHFWGAISGIILTFIIEPDTFLRWIDFFRNLNEA